MTSEGPIRVLHVVDVISSRYGGITTAIENICSGLGRLGVQVLVLATDRDWPQGRLKRFFSNPFRCKDHWRSLVATAWSPLSYAPGIDRHLDRYGYGFDLIHIHGLYRYPQYAAARFARRIGRPYIISPHGSLDPVMFNKPERRLPKRLYERLFERRNLAGANAIHYTAAEEQSLAEGLCMYRTPGFVVPLGFDLEQFRRLPSKGNFRRRFALGDGSLTLFCGRITMRKGLDLLLPAFARLAKIERAARLAVVGPDNEGCWAQYQELARQLGVEDRIVMTGMLGGEELLEAYVDADLMALPSYSENFGNVVVEAMLCGTPVLISDRVKIWREIAGSDSGIVTPCEVGAVTAGLLRLAADSELRRRLGENGYRCARKNYGIEETSAMLAGHYRRILITHRARFGYGE